MGSPSSRYGTYSAELNGVERQLIDDEKLELERKTHLGDSRGGGLPTTDAKVG
jgi:hypothetical protein